MRPAMQHRPVIGFLAQSATHSTVMFSPSCRRSFAIVVVSVSSSVASFAISSALSFPVMSMCPGTHNTSMIALLLSSRKVVAAKFEEEFGGGQHYSTRASSHDSGQTVI